MRGMAESLEDVVNLSLYPLNKPDSQEYAELLSHTRAEYKKRGLVTLPQFLLPLAIQSSVRHIQDNLEGAWQTAGSHNVFLDQGDETLDGHHIRNRRLHTQVASLPYDMMEPDGPIVRLYKNPMMIEFLREVLDLPALYRLADKLGAATVNIFKPGTSHSWHFDESSHSVTIMLQKAASGGAFRYTSPIRTIGEEGEKLHRELERIVDGLAEDSVHTLDFEPGTLSIFCGSRCLHQVERVNGEVTRLVAVLCYSQADNVTNTAEVQRLFWGRESQ